MAKKTAKKKTKKKLVPYIAQATTRGGIAYRKLPYSAKSGTAYHWTYVIRATDRNVRKLIAKGMINAVECKRIAYSNNSNTNAKLYDDTKRYKFNCLSLKKKSSTNCCNLASVACNFAGIRTPRKNSATTLPTKWAKVKGLKVYRYHHGKTKLIAGDILDANIKPHVHTAVYIGRKAR